VDPSGGAGDAMTLAIGHQDHARQVAMVDALREVTPPFSPEHVVEQFSSLLRSYNCGKVVGDRYAGEWPVDMFRRFNIRFEQAARAKSDLYVDLLASLNSRRVDLLDNPKLINQLCALERRTARSGRDSVDHPPGGHDDVANAVAGVATALTTDPGAAYLEFCRRFNGSTDAVPMASKLGDAFGTLLTFRPGARSGCGEGIIAARACIEVAGRARRRGRASSRPAPDRIGPSLRRRGRGAVETVILLERCWVGRAAAWSRGPCKQLARKISLVWRRGTGRSFKCSAKELTERAKLSPP